MKYLQTFLGLLLLIAFVSARGPTKNRNKDSIMDQVSLSLSQTGSWYDSQRGVNFHQYEGVIMNNSPHTLTAVNIEILNPNGLHLKDDGNLWNVWWASRYPPFNQFILPPGQTIYQYNVYKFTFIVQGDVYPQLQLGSVSY